MSCIDATGAPTAVAAQVLRALAAAGSCTPDDVARATALPLFRARASLRELVAEGLASADGPRFGLTERGRALLAT